MGKHIWETIHNPISKHLDEKTLKFALTSTYIGRPDLTGFIGLHDYIVNNYIEIDFRTKPWPMIHKLYPEFVARLKQDMKSYTGHGLGKQECSCSFLTSDPKKLTKRLNILIAENLAGNNNVLDEISAICDELRRKGLLSISTIKKIFSKLNHN